MRYINIGLSLFLLSSLNAHAFELRGDYSGQCGGDDSVQCAIEISASAEVSIVVADRMDYARKRCVVSGKLKRTTNGLAGEIRKGIRLSLVSTADGGVYMNGLPTSACKHNLNGYYAAIGD